MTGKTAGGSFGKPVTELRNALHFIVPIIFSWIGFSKKMQTAINS